MSIYAITIGIIFAIMLAGIAVERAYRSFAARNPQLGPFRDADKCGSCSEGSGCSDTQVGIDNTQNSSASNAHGSKFHPRKMKHAKSKLKARPPSPLTGGY